MKGSIRSHMSVLPWPSNLFFMVSRLPCPLLMETTTNHIETHINIRVGGHCHVDLWGMTQSKELLALCSEVKEPSLEVVT